MGLSPVLVVACVATTTSTQDLQEFSSHLRSVPASDIDPKEKPARANRSGVSYELILLCNPVIAVDPRAYNAARLAEFYSLLEASHNLCVCSCFFRQILTRTNLCAREHVSLINTASL